MGRRDSIYVNPPFYVRFTWMIQRYLENELKNRFLNARSVYLYGPRQSGKTTLARTTFPGLLYISLEDPDHLEFASQDPRGFLAQFQTEGIIDEPQRCPELFSYLQAEIDIKKKKFILTSSQNFLLMEKISQSLAGRISILNLLPLSKAEIENSLSFDVVQDVLPTHAARPISELLEFVITGGYPELWENKASRTYWHSDYVRTYLERDVRQILKVHDLGLFNRFLKLCAGRSGSILNKASLASDCGISETQCARWLTILEQSGIVYFLRPFYKNFNKRLIKSPKIYFNDSGLLCHLLSITTSEHLSIHPLYGNIIETFVVSEIRKNSLNKGIEPELYFWRDSQGEEVDLILVQEGQFIPIEIKSAQTINLNYFKSLEKWTVLSSNTHKPIIIYGGIHAQNRQQGTVIPIDFL